MLPYCLSEGIGVTPWSPLARGRLAKNAETIRTQSDKVQSWLYESAKANDEKVITVLNEIAKNKECKPAHIALAWLLSHPCVTCPIIGATSLEQLTDNIRSVEIVLDEHEIAALKEFYTPHSTAELN